MAGTLTRRNFLSLDFGDRRASGDHWVRVHRVAMACRFEGMLSSDDAIDVEAARAAPDEAGEGAAMLPVFRGASGGGGLNRRAAAQAVVASPRLFALLQHSAELHAGTEGAFDVTATPLSRCWGFLKRDGRVPDDVEIDRALAHVGMRHVALDDERRAVSF